MASQNWRLLCDVLTPLASLKLESPPEGNDDHPAGCSLTTLMKAASMVATQVSVLKRALER